MIVGSQMLRWEEPRQPEERKAIPSIEQERDLQVLGVMLAMLILIGEVSVASVLFNREEGLLYFGIGGGLFHWKGPGNAALVLAFRAIMYRAGSRRLLSLYRKTLWPNIMSSSFIFHIIPTGDKIASNWQV